MGKITLRDFMRLGSLEPEIQSAILVLCRHGAECKKALDLLPLCKKKRGRPKKQNYVFNQDKRPRGAPNLSPIRMEILEVLVANYKKKETIKTDKAAIEEFLKDYADSSGKTLRKIARNVQSRSGGHSQTTLVRSLQQRLSRYRKTHAD